MPPIRSRNARARGSFGFGGVGFCVRDEVGRRDLAVTDRALVPDGLILPESQLAAPEKAKADDAAHASRQRALRR